MGGPHLVQLSLLLPTWGKRGLAWPLPQAPIYRLWGCWGHSIWTLLPGTPYKASATTCLLPRTGGRGRMDLQASFLGRSVSAVCLQAGDFQIVQGQGLWGPGCL